MAESDYERDFAREFPEAYAFLCGNKHRRPSGPETWGRALRIQRGCEPILREIRGHGIPMLWLDQPVRGAHDRVVYEAIYNGLAAVDDGLAMTVCLSRLTNPQARDLNQRHRALLFQLMRKWTDRLRGRDGERTPSVMAQCLGSVARASDVPEILGWVADGGLSLEMRFGLMITLQRFARKPGLARDALIRFLHDAELGGAAVWSLARAMKAEALPLLKEVRENPPDTQVGEIAAAAIADLEARSRRLTLPTGRFSDLPVGSDSTSIELDSVRVPQLLALLDRELGGGLEAQVLEQLSLSARQLRRGRGRFHVVAAGSGLLGVGFLAEDDDVVVTEIHFDPVLAGAVAAACRRFGAGEV